MARDIAKTDTYVPSRRQRKSLRKLAKLIRPAPLPVAEEAQASGRFSSDDARDESLLQRYRAAADDYCCRRRGA